MRTRVGSSNSVARSLAQSSPSWEPRGVILTFCPNAGETDRTIASAAAAHAVFIYFSPGVKREVYCAIGRSGDREIEKKRAAGNASLISITPFLEIHLFPAIDVYRLAGDEARAGTAEKADGRRDFLR